MNKDQHVQNHRLCHLYSLELWVTYPHHLRLLERFHESCLHTIPKIYSSDFIINITVYESESITSIEAILLKSYLHKAGHVSKCRIIIFSGSYCALNFSLAIMTEEQNRIN